MNRQQVVDTNFHIDDRATVLKTKLKNLINENNILCQ